jgi:hypothetical protein
MWRRTYPLLALTTLTEALAIPGGVMDNLLAAAAVRDRVGKLWRWTLGYFFHYVGVQLFS